MRLIFITSMVFLYAASFAQETYWPMESVGEIPEEFTTLSSEKYQEAISELDGYSSHELRDRKEFLLQSNFSIDGMLQGGQVLYNDSVTSYVNLIASRIFEDNPSLPQDLRFYISRSTSSNAFSTNQGIIFITTGLISQLENEAQLAFIMCHEISHYIKKHTIEGYLESKNSLRNNRTNSLRQYAALLSNYSKSQELEADEEGLKYFLNTDYDFREANTAFDVLHYSYLPFNEVEFDIDYLTHDDFIVRPDLKIDSILPIDVFNEDYDDEESSHPNIWKRKQKVKELLKDSDRSGEKWFIVGEKRFIRNRDLCRKEGIRINLMQGQYSQAIYNSFLMQLNDSLNEYSRLATAKALYGLQQHDAFGEIREVLPKTKYIEGESSRLVYFLNELEEEELAVLALVHLFSLHVDYPNNTYYEDLYEDCLYDIVFEQHFLVSDFETEEFEEQTQVQPKEDDNGEGDVEILETLESDPYEARERSGKYGKIEEAKEEVAVEEVIGETKESKLEDPYKYSLVSLLNDSLFFSNFSSHTEVYNEQKEQQDNLSSKDKWNKKKLESKIISKRNAKILKNGTSLGLENLIVYDPEIFNYNKKSKIDYLDSENSGVFFNEKLQEHASSKGLNYSFLSFSDVANITTDEYNLISRLSAWSYEATRLESLEVEMIPSETEYVSSISDETNSRYVVITSLSNYLEGRNIDASTWLYSALLYPTLPLTIALAVIKEKHSVHSLKVLDLETGEVIHRSFRDLKVKKSERIINGVAYDTIEQLSRERK